MAISVGNLLRKGILEFIFITLCSKFVLNVLKFCNSGISLNDYSKDKLPIINICEHITEITKISVPGTPQGSEECLKSGDDWFHLRLCMTCGNVGCCDQSKNMHAAKHFYHADHP